MLVILNNELFNLDRFDNVRTQGSRKISFYRDNDELDFARYQTEEERDKDWEKIKKMVGTWYEIDEG